MGEGLEADFVGDFADAVVEIKQELFGLFHADAVEVFGVVQAGDLLEGFAKVEGAHAGVAGHGGQGDVFLEIGLDKLAGTGNLDRFGVLLADDNLVGERAELIGEELEETHFGLIFLLRHDGGGRIGADGGGEVQLNTPGVQLLEGVEGLPGRGGLEKHLAGLEPADGFPADLHAHGGFVDADGAFPGGRGIGRGIADDLLHLQAGGAGAVGVGHQGAKWILTAFTLVGELPAGEGPQGKGQAGGIVKGALILVKEWRGGQRLDQMMIGAGPRRLEI